MELDTPSEMMMSPSISLSTSLSSSSADVFSLLLTQVQQCHTQQVTELEQKLSHLKRKCQKLMAVIKERGEIAIKYRQTCHQLREENHKLKKVIKREHFGRTTSSPNQMVISSSSHYHSKSRDRLPEMEATRHGEDENKPSRSTDIVGLPDCSKKSRLALRKGNRKVRYTEVSVSIEKSPEARGDDGGSNFPAEERLFVPETMDPDLYEVEPSREIDVVHVEDAADEVVRDDISAERSKVILRNSSTPSLAAKVLLSQYNSFMDGNSKEAISPIGRSPNIQNADKYNPRRLVEEAELDGVNDGSHTQMSPTFAGHQMLSTRTSPVCKLRTTRGSAKTPSFLESKISLSDTFDQMGDSEASYLLLPQKVTPSGPPCDVQKSLLGLKRKSSPVGSSEKRLKTTAEELQTTDRKSGISRQFIFRSDPKQLEEQKLLRQSTLSQHLQPMRGSKRSTGINSSQKEDFKVPKVPETATRKQRLSIGVERPTADSNRNDETNISLSLNGSLDPIIDLDDYDKDTDGSSPQRLQDHLHPGKNQKDSPLLVGITEGSFVSADARAGEERDRSDLMFEDSYEDNSDIAAEGGCYLHQEDKEDNSDIAAEGGRHPHQEDKEDFCEIQEIVHDFDRVPRNEDSPQFKHKQVVRKHNEREKLKGFDCKQCEEFYNGMQLTDTQKEERMTACSRHRGRYITPRTPEHYWSIDFPDTPTCLQRGYIQQDDDITVDTNAMPRRRNKLKQLFPTKT